MSRVKEMIEDLSRNESEMGYEELKKTSISFRVDEQYLWRIDFLCKHFKVSRASIVQDLVEAASIEALEALCLDTDLQLELMTADKRGMSLEEWRAKMSKGEGEVNV